jgi:site-specific DNA-methyltransferase (adenine-specific)
MSKILAKIKDKPYFLKDNFVLYKENCLNILQQIPENSIDMVFADPPYMLSNGGFTVHAGKNGECKQG